MPLANIISIAFQWIITFSVWCIIGGIIIFAWFFLDLPDVDESLQATRKPIITVLSADNTVLATQGHFYGLPKRLEHLPQDLINAVLATEDRRFYKHFGLDFIGLFRAAWVNLRAGKIVQGGSTLTQQVAKNLFLTPVRSLKRKIQEVMLALWLENKFSKDQILTIYLNRAYLGAGTYGVDAAAKKYFHRQVDKITTYQAALLAGLLKAPSRYNPLVNKKLSHKRTIQVLENMVSAGYLSKEQAKLVNAQSRKKIFKSKKNIGGYFADWILAEVSSFVSIGNTDLTISTTLDTELQKKASSILFRALKIEGKIKNVQNGAILILDLNGAVLAMVGGKDYSSSQFNRVTQARRQPGSAFKPIVFLAGLEAGLTPKTVVNDAPIDINGWRPKNFDKKFRGHVTIDMALSQSINSVAVRVARKAGPKRITETARRLGIVSPLSSDLSLALGTAETTLLELVGAYSSFANGGWGVLPYGISQIKNAEGEVLYQREGSGPGRVMSGLKAAQMSRMLSAVLQVGTGKKAKLSIPAGGKTGTSQNYRDAWFLGYTGDHVAGVWVGNDDNSPMKRVTGGGLPASIWKNVINETQKKNLAAKPSLLAVNGDLSNAQKKPIFPVGNFLEQMFNVVKWW